MLISATGVNGAISSGALAAVVDIAPNYAGKLFKNLKYIYTVYLIISCNIYYGRGTICYTYHIQNNVIIVPRL